jgi:hypothetical protein
MLERLPAVDGLTFDPVNHRYHLAGYGWIAHSITKVVNDKTPAQMKRIMDSKHIWENRGNTVHQCLENFLLHGEAGDPGDYAEWVEPLVNHIMWKTWEAVAVEHRMVDTRHSIAGSFDALLRNKNDGRLVLADLKTQSSHHSKPRDISPQLGGYLNLMDQCHPGVAVNRCIGIWARPGSASITAFEGPDCIESYLAARSLFLAAQPDF